MRAPYQFHLVRFYPPKLLLSLVSSSSNCPYSLIVALNGWRSTCKTFCMLLATHSHHIVVVPLSLSNCHHPIVVLKSPLPSPLPLPLWLPLLLPLLSPSQLPLPSPFAIAVAIAVTITIAIVIAITHAVFTISPLVCPLCLLIVVLSS